MSDQPSAAQQACLALLNADPVLGRLPRAQRARLLGAMQPIALADGAVLVRRGDPAEALYLLQHGALRFDPPQPHVQTGSPLAGRCGDELLAGLPRYVLSATAAGPVAGFRIPRQAIAALISLPAGAARQGTAALAERLAGPLDPPPTPVTEGPSARPPARRQTWGLLCLGVLPLLCLALLLARGVPEPVALFAALMVMTVLLWAFALTDDYIPPLIALVASLFINLAPPSVALAAFGSPALLTLVGVFALGATLSLSGLGYRLMLWTLLRLPDHPAVHQAFALVSGLLLSTFIPSANTRMAVMLPLMREASGALQLTAGGAARSGLVIATFAGATLYSPMLATSRSANLSAVGMLPEQLQGLVLGPLWPLAALVALLTLTLVQLLLGLQVSGAERPAPLARGTLALQLQMLGPPQPIETIALVAFVLYLGGLATGGLHEVAPAWITALVLVLLLLSGSLSKQDFRRHIDWALLFFLLSTDGLVQVMHHLGIDSAVGELLGGMLAFADGNLLLFIPIALLTTVTCRLFLPYNPGMIVAFTLLLPVAQAQEINSWICLFLVSLFTDIWFHPYQSPYFRQLEASGVLAGGDRSALLRCNAILNGSRIGAVLLSIPWWQRLGLI